jgi:hypothetical protein
MTTTQSTLPNLRALLELGCCAYRDMTQDDVLKAKKIIKKDGYHMYIDSIATSWTLNTPIYKVILSKDPLPVIPDNYTEVDCD